MSRSRRFGVVLAACSIFLGALASAQQTSVVPSKNFLWRIQSKKNAVYILGSVHFLKREHYPLSRLIEGAFDDAKKLVLEIDLDDAAGQQSQLLMLQKATYGPGGSLKQGLSRETYELAEKRVRELGLDIRTLDGLEPWFIALTLATLKLKQLGFDPNYGVDRYFLAKAKKGNKDVVSLETFEFQIDLFDRMAPSLQEILLLHMLRDLDVMQGELHRMVSSWAAGDTATLEEILLTSFKEYPQVYEWLISERNKNWLQKIEGFLGQDENTMVVVGAGHLVGKDGLITLLREKGYFVEQMNN